jgi:hypothetical protein
MYNMIAWGSEVRVCCGWQAAVRKQAEIQKQEVEAESEALRMKLQSMEDARAHTAQHLGAEAERHRLAGAVRLQVGVMQLNSGTVS